MGGAVIIAGGTVIAESEGGAGIGNGTIWSASGNGRHKAPSITIKGGDVTASSINGAGIGSGVSNNILQMTGPDVVISGGKVTATSVNASGIGKGKDATHPGSLTTTSKGTAEIRASSFDSGVDTSEWRGVIYEGNVLIVNTGSAAPDADVPKIPEIADPSVLPQTGDDSNFALYMALLTIALSSLLALNKARKQA